MISLRSLRRKIKSIESIEQIFHAMKLISSARLKRTKNAFNFADSYSKGLIKTVEELYYIAKAGLDAADLPANLKPFVTPDTPAKNENICLAVITSDKGLCGGFNSNIVRASLDFINKHSLKGIKVISIGKKGKSGLLKKASLLKDFPNATSLKYSGSKAMIDEVIDIYTKEGFTKLYIAHAVFKSTLSQPVVLEQLLPLTLDNFQKEAIPVPDYLCEPEAAKLFALAIPMYIKSEFYKILINSSLAEHAARMYAMESAITNADELTASVSLQLNKLRQERITSEISELTANVL